MKNSNHLLEKLPSGWNLTKLINVGKYINGKAFKPTQWSDKGLPIIRIQNLNNVISDYNYCNFEVEKKYIIENGDLLFAWSGTPGTSFGAHIWNGQKAVLNQHIFKVEYDKKIIDKSFFKIVLNYTVNNYINQSHGSSGLAHITKSKFENSLIPLPTLLEQKKIVSIIDSTFFKIDKAITLTEENILKLKKLNESVLDEVYKNLENKNKKILSVSEISKKIQYGYTGKALDKGDYYYLRITDIQKKSVKWDLTPYSDISEREVEKYILNNGDILFARTGATAGKSYLFNDAVKSVFASYLIRVVVDKNIVLPEYLYHFFQSNNYWKQVHYKTIGAAQPNINGQKLGQIRLPIPKISEQKKIIAYLDLTTENNNKIIQHYQNKLNCLKNLKNSLLDSIFKGEFKEQEVIVMPQAIVDPYIEKNKQLNAKKNADKQAMVIALSIEAHNKLGKSLYRTKGEKTVELIEKHIGLEFGREAKKLAAGPASFQHLVKVVEPLAKTHKWFNVQEIKGDNFDSHKYIQGENFNPFLLRAVKELQSNLPEIRRVISLFANLKTTHEAEVYVTTYAGWNNLIIRKLNPDDEAIVTEARENWHEAKLKIERSEFFDAIKWLRNNNLVPKGNGKEVN